MSDVSQKIVGVGYPDFWQHAHDQFPKFFGSATIELTEICNTRFRKPLTEPLHKIARHLARMVSNSLNSVSILTLNGCGVDAMKIARSMFETSVTLGYLRLHPEEVEDYLDYHYVIQKQRLDNMKDQDPERFKQIPADVLQQAEADFERVTPRFQDRNGKVRGSWCKTNIRQMAKDVGKEKLYISFYKFASSIHHGDIGGVHASTAALKDDDVLDVDIVPSDAWLPLALIIAHGAVINALSDYNQIVTAGMDEVIERINSSFADTWGKAQTKTT
jgi:hypothetical protein